MPEITVATAQGMLDKYLAAEVAVLKGQSYTIGTRSLTRANLSTIVKERKYWQQMLANLQGGGSMRVRRFLPRDD
jgi:hypothetical protein